MEDWSEVVTVVNMAIKEGPREKVTSEQRLGGLHKAHRAVGTRGGTAQVVTRMPSRNGQIPSLISRGRARRASNREGGRSQLQRGRGRGRGGHGL